MSSQTNPPAGRLADVLPTRIDVGLLLPLPTATEPNDDGIALDVETAALAESDPAAELARLRTRGFRRGWERWFETDDGYVLHATAFVFATRAGATRSQQDHAHALEAAGATAADGVFTLQDGSDRAVVVSVVGAETEVLLQLVGPDPAATVVETLGALVRSRLAAMESSRPSS
jgi:hypothetical protein